LPRYSVSFKKDVGGIFSGGVCDKCVWRGGNAFEGARIGRGSQMSMAGRGAVEEWNLFLN